MGICKAWGLQAVPVENGWGDCGLAGAGGAEGEGRLVPGTAYAGSEEDHHCRPSCLELLKAGRGPMTMECIWSLNQPKPGCYLVQLRGGAPEAFVGMVAKPHPQLHQVTPVSGGT